MARKFVAWFDELNQLVETQYYEDRDKLNEVVEDLIILAMEYGKEDTEDMLDYFLDMDIPLERIESVLNREIDGKTTNDRINEYKAKEDGLALIQRVVETECHHAYSKESEDTAMDIQKASGQTVYKTWHTMLDGRVRDSHTHLEGVKVQMGERFYTLNGDSAEYPSQFESPEENINCRCYVSYSFE